jgi:hypothetical protein
LPGDLLASSKAIAGRVDRELRKGVPPIMAEPERKSELFAEAFADARKGAANTVTLDSYTAPDGVVVYRKTSPDSVPLARTHPRALCFAPARPRGLRRGFFSLYLSVCKFATGCLLGLHSGMIMVSLNNQN